MVRRLLPRPFHTPDAKWIEYLCLSGYLWLPSVYSMNQVEYFLKHSTLIILLLSRMPSIFVHFLLQSPAFYTTSLSPPTSRPSPPSHILDLAEHSWCLEHFHAPFPLHADSHTSCADS
ncbi:hypothetical protein K469DRAFT_706533 [Zopfia rhizophila CBS 207.26]|uniref:Uncharacterized protein n=1 Tax=Zopfia rhizophila CBS 207.26 TaxID=1314779 RepID=A0A6A6E702_9PEZI|nr:hypothetical protein K469DRAFT_706533 [Zopfia rhizophila CBS 207.26]